MSGKKTEILSRINRILENVTPLDTDCGSLCQARCCGGGEHDGMWLLPGEEVLLKNADFLTIGETEDGKYAVCKGRCDRKYRPVACRIFPCFPIPYRSRGGRYDIRVVSDVRALAVCPLFDRNAPEITPAFRRAVRRAGRLMLKDRRLRSWLLECSDYLTEIAEFRALMEQQP